MRITDVVVQPVFDGTSRECLPQLQLAVGVLGESIRLRRSPHRLRRHRDHLAPTYARQVMRPAQIARLKPLMVGEDPMNAARLWAKMYPSSDVGAIGAIDNALWDLRGKILGQPVYRLLGGVHGDLRAGLCLGRLLPRGQDPRRSRQGVHRLRRRRGADKPVACRASPRFVVDRTGRRCRRCIRQTTLARSVRSTMHSGTCAARSSGNRFIGSSVACGTASRCTPPVGTTTRARRSTTWRRYAGFVSAGYLRGETEGRRTLAIAEVRRASVAAGPRGDQGRTIGLSRSGAQSGHGTCLPRRLASSARSRQFETSPGSRSRFRRVQDHRRGGATPPANRHPRRRRRRQPGSVGVPRSDGRGRDRHRATGLRRTAAG